jgi:serine/threonine-protein kinase
MTVRHLVRLGDPAHLIGSVIDGRFEVLQLIGEGGMGVVYRARQTSIDRIVAIKMLSGELAADRGWVQRFESEARACSSLQHPNTIRMFDFGQTRDGQLFMAMEYLDGVSLRQVITEQAPLDPMRVLHIVGQCCGSLSEAHSLGIIHRDIKADNVFVLDLPGSPDHVKLLDFGVAKMKMGENAPTQIGVVFGTPQYMSPEQGRAEPLTPASDLYSVGILAYEMLTGSVPFVDPVPTQLLQMHVHAQVPPLPAFVPAPVQQLVMRALEKHPSRRHASAAAMLADAHAILGAAQSGAFLPHPPSPGAHASAASQPTVLERVSPRLSGGQASPTAVAAARTVVVGSADQPTRADGPDALARTLLASAPSSKHTVILPDSEGVVSMSPERAAGAQQGALRRAGAGASAMFWILCLLTGLAVGVGAYWLVLEFAN